MESQALSRAMVAGQIKPNRVNDPRLLAALEQVPRDRFVPKALRAVAFIDEDIEVAPGRHLMEPMVFARLLDAAEIGAGEVVLDIGCATGYSSAVLAALASAVIALDSDAELANCANELLTALGIGNVGVVVGDLAAGYAKGAPYDVIFINGAIERIPQVLIDQLAEGGRLAAVVVENGVGRGVVGRKSQGIFGTTRIMDANVPVLAAFARKKTFEF